MQYLNFDLKISSRGGGNYQVVADSPGGQASAAIHFSLSEQDLKLQLLSLRYALLKSANLVRGAISAEEQTIQDFGKHLFDTFLIGNVRSCYDATLVQARYQTAGVRLRLHVDNEAPELAVMPWEFLYDERQSEYICLSRITPLVRFLDFPQPIQPLTIQPPLRILCMIASPSDQQQLDVQREKSRIGKALGGLEAQGLVQVYWLPGQTYDDLQQALLPGKGPWHIFHYIGHGGFDSARQEGVLALVNEQGKTQYLYATQLRRMLTGQLDHPFRMVLLNACEGAHGDEKDIFSSTAATLARGGIPAVLAMQYQITDEAAIELTQAFYRALASGMAVDEAVAEGRRVISGKFPKRLEWGTPVLYMRSPDGKLFQVSGQHTRKTKEQWLAEGRQAQDAQRFDEALNAYQAAIALDPKYANAHFCRGDVLRLQGETLWLQGDVQKSKRCYDDAITALDRAIQLNPHLAAAYRRKGYVLQELQRYEEALYTLDIALQKEPAHALAHLAKGDALQCLKRYREAITAYDQALKLEPGNKDAFVKKEQVQRFVSRAWKRSGT